MQLDNLKSIELRQVWVHETSDFSRWLSQPSNLKILGRELGMDLEIIKREALAGKFRADLLAKDRLTDELVIIENQLEDTNHSHLGQLITYSSHYETKNIIWIVKDLRIEHEKALDWLNRNLSEDIKIFLVRIELFTIGDSLPAPKFTLILKPYGWTNTRFRKEIEIEQLPKSLIEFEKIKKSIVKPSLINFLNHFIQPDETYPKRELLDLYSKKEQHDSNYYISHPFQFKKDLISWAKLNNLILNKDYQNDKCNGNHKSGGIEYVTFNQ